MAMLTGEIENLHAADCTCIGALSGTYYNPPRDATQTIRHATHRMAERILNPAQSRTSADVRAGPGAWRPARANTTATTESTPSP